MRYASRESIRASATQRARRAFRAAGRLVCAVCGYSVVVDVHHICPVSADGNHDAGNLLPLCANHHRVVHARWGRGTRRSPYRGPLNASEVVSGVLEFEADPDGWRREQAAQVARLVSETI